MNTLTHGTLKHASALVALLGGALSVPASTPPAAELFAVGNRAYVEGDYGEAIRCYESVAEEGGVSAALFYNLANAYREQGDLGHAILNYERALWLAPRDPDVLAAVHSVREEAALFTEPSPSWTYVAGYLSLARWSWLAFTAWAALGALVLAWGLVPGGRWCGGLRKLLAPVPYRSLVLLTLVVLGLGVAGTAYKARQLDRAVVSAEEAPLLVSPYEAADRVASLREGRIVEVQDAHGPFVRVIASTGSSGWVSVHHLDRVVPCPADEPGGTPPPAT